MEKYIRFERIKEILLKNRDTHKVPFNSERRWGAVVVAPWYDNMNFFKRKHQGMQQEFNSQESIFGEAKDQRE